MTAVNSNDTSRHVTAGSRCQQQDLTVAHLLADGRYALLHLVPHRPVGPGSADAGEEVPEDLRAAGRVVHLRVELQPVEATLLIGDGRVAVVLRTNTTPRHFRSFR